MSTYDVIIVGAGVFGLSTAVQLARSNYKVIVIDKMEIPSPLSASYDYNKIVRLEYNDPVYADMAVEAMGYWNGNSSSLLPRGLLHDSYSHCGRLSIVQEKTSSRYLFEEQSLKLLSERFNICKNTPIYDNLSCDGLFPQFNKSVQHDPVRYNPECGIGLARKSLVAMKQYAEILGVTFIESDGVTDIQTGFVKCDSGNVVRGHKIVIACGANTTNLLPMSRQIRATGLYVGHVQLTSEEYTALKNMPVVFNGSLGYLFPPDQKTKIMKICTSAMSTYDDASNNLSPVYKTLQPSKTPSVPLEAIVRIRTVLGKYLPQLVFDNKKNKLRDIIDCKICWISDTSNADFIIDEVPGKNNVFVCCGDSGHAYKFLPNLGHFVKLKLEGLLPESLAHKWRWRNSDWERDEMDWRVEPKKIPLSKVEWYKENYGQPRL